eukprot:408954-Lingulodinium_polyedra.AAC.1
MAARDSLVEAWKLDGHKPPSITLANFFASVCSFQGGKKPGNDGIVAEMVGHLSLHSKLQLWDLFNRRIVHGA